MNEYLVYRLRDPRDQAVFYVGITNDLDARFKQHLLCDGSSPEKDGRIQEICQQGLQPSMEIIEAPGEVRFAREREAYWINRYLQEHAPLTNVHIPAYDGKRVVNGRSVKASVRVRDAGKKRLDISLDKAGPTLASFLKDAEQCEMSDQLGSMAATKLAEYYRIAEMLGTYSVEGAVKVLLAMLNQGQRTTETFSAMPMQRAHESIVMPSLSLEANLTEAIAVWGVMS
jgi:hypothetical protein